MWLGRASNQSPAQPESRPNAPRRERWTLLRLWPQVPHLADHKMIGNADLSGQRGEVAIVTLPDMPTCNDQAMPANGNVVSDLHEVVDLGALADDGIAGGAAVDRGIGANLDLILDDRAGFAEFFDGREFGKKPKLVLADADAQGG